MVVKTMIAVGVALVVGAWILVVPYSPEATQMSMNSSANSYRNMGYLPDSGTTIMSRAIGHGVFEVPDSDKLHMAVEMEGMEMGSADDMPMDSNAEMNSSGDMPVDSMAEMDHADEPKEMESMANMQHDEDAGNDGPEGHGDEAMTMKAEEGDHDEEEAEAGHSGGEGLEIVKSANAKIDKTIEIVMDDWGYNLDHAMVMKGQTVRLLVTNNGNTPHEFMLMSMAGMEAIKYRLQRADWNLLEHEALFEVPVMMPGDTVEAVIKIEDSGMWMFMCMFPYHMQMGMMSMMMTPDMMGMMGSMGNM